MTHKYSNCLFSRVLTTLLLVCPALMGLAQDYTQNGVNYYIDGAEAYVGSSKEATGTVTILDKITVDAVEYPVTKISNYAFEDAIDLTEINFPGTLTEIGSYAFKGCKGLTSVSIPNSVTTLKDRAFRECSGLLTVTIGSGVTSIEYDAFYQCVNVTDIYMYANLETLEWNDGDYDDFMPSGRTVCHVDNAALWGEKFTGLIRVIFRDENTIPFSWSYNESTHTLTLSGTEAMPDYEAYERGWNDYAGSIETIVIENGVTTIGRNAFNGCRSLTSISIPASVVGVGIYAFAYCENLPSVKFPASLKYIRRNAFAGCKGLTSINIPASVTEFATNAFEGCSNLTNINIASANETYKSVNGAVYSKDGTTLFCCPNGKTAFTFADGVTTIESYAFSSCSKLAEITIPGSVTTINSDAFSYCEGLTSVVIPDGVNYLGSCVFCGCDKLKTAKIGNGLSSISSQAFGDCTSLTSVTLGSKVKSIFLDAFKGCTSMSAFIVDPSHSEWKSFAGVIYSKDGATLVKCPAGLSHLDIPAGVSDIQREAFTYCNLESVSFPSNMTEISSYAFYQCSSLKSITIPETIKTIKDRAFRECYGLQSVTIGSGVTSIEYDAFYCCGGVTDIYMYANPETLEWADGDIDDFKSSKATICHVLNAEAFQEKFGETVNATFVGDLMPQIATTNYDGSYLTTYYNSTANVKVDAGTKVYKVAKTGSTLLEAEIEDRIINAGQGVILKSTGETIAMAPTEEASSTDYSDNILTGVDAATKKASGYWYYTLSSSNSTLGFYEIAGNTLPAHKAFIRTSSAQAGGQINFDNATGISTMDEGQRAMDDVIYNLAGQRLGKMQKGINIIGGKKVLVK